MAAPLLEVDDVHKKFGNLAVLKGASLKVDRGQTKVIIGPSGAGKSTLLRCINLLVKPDSGRVLLDGQEITAKGVKLSTVRSEIGFVFQSFNLFMHLTAIDNIRLGLVKVKKMQPEEATRAASEALLDVGIDRSLFGHFPAQLSGGQQQRVAIARSIAMKTKIILLDEPTSALDPELIGEVLRVMEQLAESHTTMLAVTHEIGFARKVADEIIFMDQGKVLESGPPDSLLSSPKEERTRRFLSKMEDLYGSQHREGD
ncbi:MAG TPA: amino acid ABC transporter ATP-binding protein [Conexivisphaerales archaeon]|nr:amino acid ABC transporter ATP-binding protein [Conexivisphaerales archaeon]